MRNAGARARARNLADSLLREFGLDRRGWAFTVNGRLRSSFGMCYHRKRVVSVASWLVESCEWEKIQDTVRHEVAHACAYVFDGANGHGKVWKRWARKLGASPTRCGDREIWERNTTPKWLGTCVDCGLEVHRNRLAKRYRGNMRTEDGAYYGGAMCPKCQTPEGEHYSFLVWEELR